LPVLSATTAAAAVASSQREEKPCTCEACKDKRYIYIIHFCSRNSCTCNMHV
jgi:hypothetical protein